MLIWNMLLAVTWAALSGEFSLGSIITGFVLGFFTLMLVRRDDEARRYFRRSTQIALFLPYFIKELIVANLRMARDVLRPLQQMKPAIIGLPLEVTSESEITALATLITLTPGTLSLDVSSDRRTLYIHAMSAADAAEVRASIKEGLERRVLEVMR